MNIRRILFFVTPLLGSFILFQGCTPGSTEKKSSTKFKQYYIKGESLYLKHCSNCHQKNGTGLGLLYPPLNRSDYMDANIPAVVCLIRHGIQGEIIVNGKSFNKEMPGIPQLTDLEIAQVSTYIYNTWTHQHGILEVKEVSQILKDCAGTKQ